MENLARNIFMLQLQIHSKNKNFSSGPQFPCLKMEIDATYIMGLLEALKVMC